MKNSFDFPIIFLVNVIFTLGVNGRVVTRTIIPISPQYITPIKTNHPQAQLPNRPDWPKIILTKHLLEFNCLQENYNKHQLNKQQQYSQLHGRKPVIIPFSGKRGNNLGDLKFERERENFFKNTKRRRYYGDNDKIILTPIKQAGWEIPLYIRASMPEKEHLPRIKNPQKQPATSQSKINANQHIKNSNGDKWLNGQENSNPANAINVQTSGTFKEEKLTGNPSPSPDIAKNEKNNQEANNKEMNKIEKNPNYFPVTFRWPTRKPLPNDYKFSKFSKFPEKLQALFAKNVSGPYKWIQTRPQPIRPYEVKEIAEENVQVNVTKDDPLINRGKPQSGVGGGLLNSPISTKVSTKPNTEDTFELLQNSISKILQGLMGSKAEETIQKQKTHIPKEPLKPQEIKKATPLAKTPFPPKKYPIKNPPTYSYDLAQRRNFEEGQTNTKQPFLPRGNEPTSNSFTAEEIIPDYQKVLSNFLSNYVHERKPTSDQHPGTSFSRNMLLNNSTQTTNAVGRDLKLTNSSPLPDLSTFTTQEQSEPEENDKSQKFTFIPDMTSNYYQHTDEVTLTSSSPYDETSITLTDPFIWLKTDQTLTSSPETTETRSTLFSEPSHPSTLDLSESTVVVTTTPLTEAPESYSTSISQERENIEKETEDQTPGKYTTENYQESNNDPLTIDLLPTNKSDVKNQEAALKNGRKMNFDVDSDDTELTNSLSSQTSERRSDILIEDALYEYENTTNDISSSGYMSKLKKFMSNSNFTIDDVISVVPSIVDDLRQKKVQSEDVTILSQVFGKYWPDILTLSKDATLDVMLLLKMKNEDDLKNILGKYIRTTYFETTTMIDSVDASEEKANNPPAYDYIDEYKDLYEDMTEHEVGTEKRKRFRPKRENKIPTPHKPVNPERSI